jgi:hypothetical protein
VAKTYEQIRGPKAKRIANKDAKTVKAIAKRVKAEDKKCMIFRKKSPRNTPQPMSRTQWASEAAHYYANGNNGPQRYTEA